MPASPVAEQVPLAAAQPAAMLDAGGALVPPPALSPESPRFTRVYPSAEQVLPVSVDVPPTSALAVVAPPPEAAAALLTASFAGLVPAGLPLLPPPTVPALPGGAGLEGDEGAAPAA